MTTRDPVTALLAVAEELRATARSIETLELGDAQSRDDLRALIADLRYRAFCAVSLAALELRPACLGARRAG